MTKKKQETLRERMERIWAKRRPDSETELTAEGMKVETPTEGEFFGNLEKASELPHPRQDQNGAAT